MAVLRERMIGFARTQEDDCWRNVWSKQEVTTKQKVTFPATISLTSGKCVQICECICR